MATATPTAASNAKTRARRAPGARRWSPLLVPPILLLAWQLLASVVSDLALASPAEALSELLNGARQGWLWENLFLTLDATFTGFWIAAVIGLWFGFLLGLSKFWSSVWEPFLLGIYAIPKITLFPVFLFLFGLGLASKTMFGMFHGVFPIILFTMYSVATMPPVYIKTARAMNLGKFKTFRSIIVPASLPQIVAGLRFGFSLCFLGVVIGEMFASRAGSGYLLVKAISIADTPRMLAIIVALVVVALAVNWIFLAIEHRLARRRGKAGPVDEPEAA